MSGLMVIILVVAVAVVLSSVGGLVWFFNRRPANETQLSEAVVPEIPAPERVEELSSQHEAPPLESAPSPLVEDASPTIDDPLPEAEEIREPPLARSSDKPLDSKVQAALSAYINSDNEVLARTLHDIDGAQESAEDEVAPVSVESAPELISIAREVSAPISEPVIIPKPEPEAEIEPRPEPAQPLSAPETTALLESGPLPPPQSDPQPARSFEAAAKAEPHDDKTVENPEPFGALPNVDDPWPETPSVMSSISGSGATPTPTPSSLRELETRPAVPAVMPKANRAPEPVIESMLPPSANREFETRPAVPSVPAATELEIEDAFDQAFSPGGTWLDGNDDDDVQGGLMADIFGQEWSADMFAAPDAGIANEGSMSVDSDDDGNDSTLKVSRGDLKGLMPDFFDKKKK